jgi:EAL domain-containing protein (putative c-di-GMP-specific phosphodiesterase class I)
MTEHRLRLLLSVADAGTSAAIAERLGALNCDCLRVGTVEELLGQLVVWKPSHVLVDLSVNKDDEHVLAQMASTATGALVMLAAATEDQLNAAERLGFELGLAVVATATLPVSLGNIDAFLLLGGQNGHLDPQMERTASFPQLDDRSLRHALSDGQLFVVYQPRIACATGQLEGFEALLRWHHPQHGPVDARHFIEQADALGMLDAVTDFVLEEGLRWLAESPMAAGLGLSVNIAMSTLAEPSLADRIMHFCDRFEVAPSRLTLDIPEFRAPFDARVIETLDALRTRAVRVALDNFTGTHTRFDDLARLSIDEIKLDRRVVQAAGHSDEDRRMVLATAGFAGALGLRSVAEGVETLESFRFLKDAGFTLAQGYFIGRPMQADGAAAWMGVAV